MPGKVVLITGAASGIGLAAAAGFARLRASLRVLGRSDERAGEAAGSVLWQVPGADVRPVTCDLGSIAEVRAFTRALHRRRGPPGRAAGVAEREGGEGPRR
ncbi:SDR family NAD(P)-dependent oxidoreductase [Amycolatopsis panacis]|uniref:SDR family NAD(P)-dependent oxidoreductase n=1 Tax=Amycolatopsis panacis TaxID=2340917 RepID=A0A419I212_9PSEU|nr:SDR family NAD(P)-dependent oxidoreductase [Amycolatopsis panacis]RJQ83834.1 SDR family NAD(P)-dependent oxidoreductase [Amycolatopsis panacis]